MGRGRKEEKKKNIVPDYRYSAQFTLSIYCAVTATAARRLLSVLQRAGMQGSCFKDPAVGYTHMTTKMSFNRKWAVRTKG